MKMCGYLATRGTNPFMEKLIHPVRCLSDKRHKRSL